MSFVSRLGYVSQTSYSYFGRTDKSLRCVLSNNFLLVNFSHILFFFFLITWIHMDCSFSFHFILISVIQWYITHSFIHSFIHLSTWIDLETTEALIEAIDSFEGGVLLVSHDQHLLTSVCKDLYVVEQGNVSRLKQGTTNGETFEAYKKAIIQGRR